VTTNRVRDAPIRAFASRIRRATGRQVSDFDPTGPGAHGRVLILLRDPGGSEGGALQTGYVSPWTNDDATARNERRLISASTLTRTVCLFWNAFPWDLQGCNPTVSDRERGAQFLRELIELLPRLRAIVACGNEAHDVCRRGGITDAIETCHPGDQGLSGGVKGARAGREADFIRKLGMASRRASDPKVRPYRDRIRRVKKR
jgi:hypothetical protein